MWRLVREKETKNNKKVPKNLIIQGFFGILRKPAREPHLHGVLAACLRSFSRTLTADSRIKSIDRGNIIWYHIHALAVTEDSATVRTDTSAVNGVGGKSDAMR